MIRKTKGGYAVFSHSSGKRLSKPGSKAEAQADLRRIKHFAKGSGRMGPRRTT